MMQVMMVLMAALPASQPQSLIIDSGRADRIQTPPLPTPQPEREKPAQKAADLTRVDATGADRPIKGIRFDGAKVPAPVAQAARRFIDQPANRKTLEKLALAMSEAYGHSDVALYTVAIPDQDLSQGLVRVKVAQGFIEDITYPKGASPLMRAYAEHLRGMRPLSRRVLERYLSLMRDVAGASVEAQLLRGRQAGGVILALTIKRKKIDGSLSYDNAQSQYLGTGEFNAQLSVNSLLRDGDETKLNLLVARDFHSFVYAALSHGTPLGSGGLKLNLTGAWLQTRVDSLNLRGSAEAAGLSLSYPVIRGYKRNLTVSAGIDGLNSDSALFGTTVSSDHIRAARLAAGYSMAGSKAVLSVGATLSKGLGILQDHGTAGFSDPLFTKANVTAAYDRVLGRKIVIRLKAQGQYSGNPLPATERIAFGGADYGRAFDTAAITADSGVAGSVELAWRVPLGKHWAGTELYAFTDHASLRINDRLGAPRSSYDLGSAGGGLRLAYGGRASVNVEAAKAVTDPFNGALGDWRVNISWKLSLHQL